MHVGYINPTIIICMHITIVRNKFDLLFESDISLCIEFTHTSGYINIGNVCSS